MQTLATMTDAQLLKAFKAAKRIGDKEGMALCQKIAKVNQAKWK